MAPTGADRGGEDRRSRSAYVIMAAIPLIPLTVGLLFVLAGSGGDDRGLDDARTLWHAEGPDAYVMVLEVEAMTGPAAVTVVVEDGVLAGAESIDSGVFPVRARAVEELFDKLETSLDTGDVRAVEWHPDLGYPVSAQLDPDPGAIDDEWSFAIISFEPLSP